MTCTCDFGSGLSTCHCPACERTFTSVSAFDKHQRTDDAGAVACLDPAAAVNRSGEPVFTVYRKTTAGRPVWGKYDARGSRPTPRELAAGDVGAEISRPNRAVPIPR